ncbi:hypothetical protein [Bacillus chungangensis]|uniref:Uncharacterized protein n=1 Tax=Bacillus chungangensis TaxID=587633 RepID=A0ABT9WT96_9BACI|nr:hypothetical protein [Bacillus chungangensis]MDQ0176450.1 hypothetical protein [Bacillus chungangensis]
MDKNLRTVSLLEALKKIEYLCDIEIPEKFYGTILYINKIRNNFMHYEMELDEKETDTLVTNLQVCYEETIEFLEIHIDDLEDYIQDSRFELSHEEYEEQQAEFWAEMRMEDMKIEAIESAYEDLGEGKW